MIKSNDFIKKSWDGDFEANYRGLAAVNSKTYESEDALAAAQKNYLVTDVAGLNAGSLNGGVCQFDKDVYTYGNYLTKGELVLYSSERRADLFHLASDHEIQIQVGASGI